MARRFARWSSLRWIAVIAGVLLPVGVVAGAAGIRGGEDSLLATASARLEAGELEPALAVLQRLESRRILSPSARRSGALMLFRLGEDRRAHDLLLGIQFREDSSEDVRLQEWSARCQRASALFVRLETETDPDQRVDLARQAVLELPDAPGVLQRAAQESLLAMVHTGSPEHAEAFEQDYLELRRKAPSLAAELQERLQGLAAEAEQVAQGTQ
jgi:hypothetical protein